MINYFKNIMNQNKKSIYYFKIIVTFSLCLWILWNNDWGVFQDKAQNLKLWLIPVVFLFYLAAQAISAYKWKLVLSVHGIHFTFKKLHSYYYTAMFFNNFLPTSIGGDGYRIYKTISNPKSKACAVISILVERITGVFALLVLGLGGAFVGYVRDDGLSIVNNYFGLIFAGVVLSGVMNAREGRGGFLLKPFREVLPNLNDYAKNIQKTIMIMVISFLFHILSMTRFFLLVLITGESCSIFDLVFVVAISMVVGMIPISLNGIGLMDGSFIYFIAKYGVSPEAGLMVMILTRLLLIPISLVGGYIYLREKRVRSTL